MGENENKPSDSPKSRWREALATSVMFAALTVQFVALFIAAVACFYFLPGPLKALCIVPWFVISMYINGDHLLFEICVTVAIGSLLTWIVYLAILSKMESYEIQRLDRPAAGYNLAQDEPHVPR